MTGFARWLWWRARGWPRRAWCERWHYRRWWLVEALAGGEATVRCGRCGRRWVQLVPWKYA